MEATAPPLYNYPSDLISSPLSLPKFNQFPGSPLPSAPMLNPDEEIKIIELQTKTLKERQNDLNLDVIKINLEYLSKQVKNVQTQINEINANECDKQCKEANSKIESNTVNDFLNNQINAIFNK